jgi:hypothetical protein
MPSDVLAAFSSEGISDKAATSGAKIQALAGRRVFTGTPPSLVMAILPRVARPYAANAEGDAPFQH